MGSRGDGDDRVYDSSVFDIEGFVAECQVANAETEPTRAIRELLDRTMSSPSSVADAMRPGEGGMSIIYSSPDLTVLNIVWPPGMVLLPHDHRMWAAIGVYCGREDNTFYVRDADDGATIVESASKTIEEGGVSLLGSQAIHGVANPTKRLTAAIHVYGGDFVNEPRSQWGPGDLRERPYDLEYVLREFRGTT